MIGTHLETKGGISSVVNVYRATTLFEKWNVKYIPTSCDGSFLKKFGTAFRSFLLYTTGGLITRADLVHIHMASRFSFWRKLFFILVAFSMKVPVIIHLHGGEFNIFYDQECSEWKRRIIRYTFERSKNVITLSTFWSNWVRLRFPAADVRVVFNPVLYAKKYIVDIRRVDTILFLGRIGQKKGVFDLIDAILRLVPLHPNLKLLLGGDGAIEETKSRAHKIEVGLHVETLGWIAGDMKNKLLSQSTLYVLPSYNEGLPMSILEAMAAGLPIVSTKVGGIPEAVTDGVEGFLIEPGDVEALAKCIDVLLSDLDLRHRMGAAGRKKIQTVFSADIIVPKIEALYSEITGR
ncbi:glycosyltransferase [Desulfobacter postgatei 2ac9]|uniref:Glycosyltransferase n=2 Tax=Desulfobacter postgatei TaxID=2293 RepID=I5B6K7_9BACT|nr:glycosyltransferase [Desulfobacter postgatei 2ac9]